MRQGRGVTGAAPFVVRAGASANAKRRTASAARRRSEPASNPSQGRCGLHIALGIVNRRQGGVHERFSLRARPRLRQAAPNDDGGSAAQRHRRGPRPHNRARLRTPRQARDPAQDAPDPCRERTRSSPMARAVSCAGPPSSWGRGDGGAGDGPCALQPERRLSGRSRMCNCSPPIRTGRGGGAASAPCPGPHLKNRLRGATRRFARLG